MKRLLISAAVAAVFSGPALAQNDQHQDHHTAAPAHTEHPSSGPAPHTYAPPPSRTFAPPAGHAPTQSFAPAYHPSQSNLPGSARTYVPYSHFQGGGSPRVAPNQPYRAPGDSGSQYGAYRSYQGAGQYRNNGQYQGSGQYRNNRQYQGSGQYRNNGQYQGSGQYRGNTWTGGQNGHNGDWWRSHRGFEHYRGHRSGFWFAPGFGYYQVDPQWYDYDWEVGAEVPYSLRSYYVSDPYDYGLPQAPYGCAWIFLGDEIVLIDLQSGEIIQIADSY
jgi:Ni/Co efflux regulator RcnB